MKTETEKLTVFSITDRILPNDSKSGNMAHTSNEVKRIALRGYIQEYADQEKQALKDELIKKVKESNLSGLSKATVFTLITQL